MRRVIWQTTMTPWPSPIGLFHNRHISIVFQQTKIQVTQTTFLNVNCDLITRTPCCPPSLNDVGYNIDNAYLQTEKDTVLSFYNYEWKLQNLSISVICCNTFSGAFLITMRSNSAICPNHTHSLAKLTKLLNELLQMMSEWKASVPE